MEFQPRWKEELVCSMDGRQFVLEMPMGVLTVYLPSESKWDADAPEWASHQWERVRDDLVAWCAEQSIPVIIEDSAWVSFE
jgi:hypothetical protein